METRGGQDPEALASVMPILLPTSAKAPPRLVHLPPASPLPPQPQAIHLLLSDPPLALNLPTSPQSLTFSL